MMGAFMPSPTYPIDSVTFADAQTHACGMIDP